MSGAPGSYYLPNPSAWPIIGSIGLFTLALGFVFLLNDVGAGPWIMLCGAAIILYMMAGWFGAVIGESESGQYNDHVDVSFRMSMGWFIFSEVMFFAAFFGALFYARVLAVPWLADTELLWPGYGGGWPTAGPEGASVIAADTPGFLQQQIDRAGVAEFGQSPGSGHARVLVLVFGRVFQGSNRYFVL